MPKEFEHRDEDVEPGAVEPTTRDDVTPPVNFSYLTFDSEQLTFRNRKMMMRSSDG